MDDAVKAATDSISTLGDNKVSLGSDSGTTTAKKLSTTGGIKFNIKGETGANALITTSATGDDVTIAPTAKLSAAVTAAEKSADKDLSNLSAAGDTYIKNLAKTAASWNVETNGGGTTAVAGGESVNFINGDNIAITNAGRAITIGTAKNVSFDKVTVGGVVLDKTDGINAGGKEVKGIADGTAADSAVSKGQMETAIANAQTAATSTEKVIAKSLTGDTNLATVTGQTGTAKGETYEVAVSENAVKNVAKAAAQDAVTVTGTGLATVSDNTTGGVKTYTVNVDEGKLVLDDTTGKIGANGATQGTTAGKNGVATTQNVATAINDAIAKSNANTAQALADVEHKFDGDTGTTSVRKHGEVLSIKGGVTTPADLATGNIGVVSDGAGTLNIRLAKVLSGLTSATFTTAGGNTTVINGDGVTITPSGAGASAISMTTDGINAGGKEVKGIADGTAADSAVSKGQMETAIANAQTAATSTEKVIAKALTGDTNLATVTGQTGTAKGETYEVAVSENAVKNVAKAAAQDAVTITGTGLATVSDNTTGGVKTYTVNVDEGKLVLDDTTGKIGANGATQGTTVGKNGVATTQNVATAINDAVAKAKASTTQALADAEHKFDGDTGATSVRKHGEVLSIKGGVTNAADLATGNIGVVSDGAGTLNIRLAKILSGLTSATFKDASGNTTMVTGGSTTIADTSGNTQTLAPTKSEIKDNNGVSTVTTKDGVTAKDASGQTTSLTKGGVNANDGNGNTTSLTNTGVSATDGNGHTTGLTNGGLSTTDGTNTTTVAPTGITATDGTNTVKLNGSGIDAGNTQIKNVGKATTDDAAVNKKQMDDAITKATADATHEFGGDDATVVSRKHGEKLTIKGGATTTDADLTSGNIAVIGDATNGALNIKLAKALTGLTSATFKDASGNTTMVTGGSTTIADTFGNTQTLAPTKSEIKDNNGVSTVTTKDGVTAKDASGQTTSLTKGGVNATDGNGNTTSLTNTGVSATDGNGHTTGLTNGGLSTTDGTNTTTVAPTGMTATDGTNTVKVGGSGIDAGGTEIKHIAAGTAADSAVNKGQMDDAITKATADAAHKFDGDTGATSVRKHGEVLSIKGGVTDTNKLSDNNIGVISDGAGTLNVKLSKDLTGLTSATFKDGSGNTQTVTGASSTITDGTGNTTAMTKGGLSTTDGTNTTTVAPTGVTATDGTNIVKLNGSGIDAGNTQIKNVGKATTDDAAVNKKQMDEAVKAASDATKALGNNTITLGGDSVSTTTAKALNTTGGIQFNIKGQTGTDALITTSASGDDVTITPTDKLTNAVKAAEKSADKDLSNLSAAGNTHIQDLAKSAASWNVQTNGNGTTAVVGGDTVNFINGDNIAITNTGHAITIGTAKNVSFDKVTVGGMTLDKNGLLSGITSITGAGSGAPTMTFNSQNGNTPANVSINSNLDMGGHRITGVGPAEKPTDAVNKQQVDQALRGLTGMADNAARQYASKAGANAAALAALKPIQYDPLEPTQIMAGVGNYKSQTAVALGMAHYTNENTMFNIGVSLDSHDNMVNAGVTHKFGYSPEKKAIPDRYKGGPISSIYVMQDEMQALLAKDQEKDAVISKQASEIDTLRQQNEDMQRKIEMILAKLQ